VVVKQVLVEEYETYTDPETGEQRSRKVLKRYYTFEEGPKSKPSNIRAEPRGIVSISAGKVKGLKAGTATVVATTRGYLQRPSGYYTPEEYQSLKRGELTASQVVSVHEYTGMRFEVSPVESSSYQDYINRIRGYEASEVGIFFPSNPELGRGYNVAIDIFFKFLGPEGAYERINSGRSVGELVERMKVTSSDEEVVPLGQWVGSRFQLGYYIEGRKSGMSILTFSVLNEEGIPVGEQCLPVMVNKVKILVNGEEDVSKWQTRAGEVGEIIVKIEGGTDMSKYKCIWGGYKGNPQPDEARMEAGITTFRGQRSTNYVSFPTQIEPGSSISMSMSIQPRDWKGTRYYSVFSTWYYLAIKAAPAELKRLVLKVRHCKTAPSDFFPFIWVSDPNASPFWPAEIHLFNWPGAPNRSVDIIEEGYFTDWLTTEVSEDTRKRLYEITELELNPPYADCIWVHTFKGETDISMFKVGTCIIRLKTPAVEDHSFYNKEDLRSVNSLKVYADEVWLDWASWPTVSAGSTETLTLYAQTEGELSDYEVVWALDPDVGELETQVTQFTQDEEGNWYSENQWDLPNTVSADTIQIKAMIRKKGTQIELGGAIEDAEISSIRPVLLNEVCPAGGWIEIFNPEPVDIPIAGCRLIDGDGQLNFTIPEEGEDWDGVLESGGYLVIHLIPGLAFNTPGEDIRAEIGDVLDVSGDSVALLSPSGDGMDFMRYGDSTDVPPSDIGWGGDNPASPEGSQSLGRSKDSLDTDNGSDWESSGGADAESPTPGRRNLRYLPGDVSMNGRVSAYDAALVLRYLVGKLTLSDVQLAIADVTGRKGVTALDAAVILQYAVGLIDKFPVEEEGVSTPLGAASERMVILK